MMEQIVDRTGARFQYCWPPASWDDEWLRKPRYFGLMREPSCLIGHILWMLGFGAESVKEGFPLFDQPLPIIQQFTPPAMLLLCEAQRQQDMGLEYGDILDSARRRAGDL